jgi:protein O-GlcNAc transferase
VKRRKFSQTVAADPHVVRALEARFAEGKKHEEAEDFVSAEKIYREIVSTYHRHGFNPATPNAALGYALLLQEKYAEAENALKRSAQQDPGLLEAHANLAALYRATRSWQECVDASRRALEINPQHVGSLVNMGEAQKELREIARSIQSFLLALTADKESLEAKKGLACSYAVLGEASVSLPLFREVFKKDPNSWRSKSLMFFAMQSDPLISNEEVLQEHLIFGEQLRREIGPPATNFANDRNANRPLRVGYLSDDFRYHVVMRFVEHVFASHDRSQFEIALIATNQSKDQDTERIRRHANTWLDVSDLPDSNAARVIQGQNLDILVDLGGHSGNSRATLLGYRLAPLQMTWCGYSGTTGIDSVDYIIVDDVLAPLHEKTFFSERALRLPGGFLCYKPQTSPDIGAPPFATNGYVTFGCMNNPSKINKYVVSWWSELLKAVPDSKLLLAYALYRDPLVRERVVEMFKACGIPPERYQILGFVKEFWSVYRHVDIALDTFPYNGTTTTCEALWMGVPVITLRGDRFVARVGASLLTHTGLSQLIGETPEQYVQTAAQLAQDPECLTNLRQHLRSHLLATPTFEAKSFTKNLESAYKQAFQSWCEQPQDALVTAETARKCHRQKTFNFLPNFSGNDR